MRYLATIIVSCCVVASTAGCEPALLTPLEEDANNSNAVTNNASTGNNTSANNSSADTNPYAGDMAAAVDGEELYTSTSCNTCHGAMGEGTASFPSLEMTAMLSDREVFDSIYDGRTGTAMSPYGEESGGPLSEDDVWKVVTFVRTLEE